MSENSKMDVVFCVECDNDLSNRSTGHPLLTTTTLWLAMLLRVDFEQF